MQAKHIKPTSPLWTVQYIANTNGLTYDQAKALVAELAPAGEMVYGRGKQRLYRAAQVRSLITSRKIQEEFEEEARLEAEAKIERQRAAAASLTAAIKQAEADAEQAKATPATVESAVQALNATITLGQERADEHVERVIEKMTEQNRALLKALEKQTIQIAELLRQFDVKAPS